MFLNQSSTDVLAKARALLEEVKALNKPDMSAEDKEKSEKMVVEITALKDEAARLSEIEKLAGEIVQASEVKAAPQQSNVQPGEFKSLGDFARAIYLKKFHQVQDPRLPMPFHDPSEPATPLNAKGWVESLARGRKDLVENIAASGGFLVPIQQMTELLQVPGPELIVRPRATIVPMQRRQIQWPTLDQTNTTSGRPAWYGGVLGYWTEEAAEKDETEPKFRQINLVAHKLVTYTEASDELLEDSAISLEALLGQLFRGSIDWYEEEAFVNGIGGGQPLGIINAGATFHQVRAAAGAVGIADVINMLEHFHGTNPVWLASRSLLPSIIGLNGPAGNASYVFISNAVDSPASRLMGYPLFWCEHCPLIGNQGDLVLADLKMYLVGDRKATAIDASKDYKFKEDLTAWRAVHRVDGQPWLSQPIYQSDGTTQVSPFVILDNLVS